MNLRSKRQLLSLSVTLALTLTNCATQLNNTTKTNTIINNTITNNISSQLKGQVNFPLSFKIKATVPEVRTKATVSLIYPSDYPVDALKDATIATGLTDSNGQFNLNLGTFNPQNNVIYVLEAIKRIGGAGNYQMALRTNVRWNGTSWQSMTTPSIDIDTVTTALAIISNLNPQDISSAQTIGTIPSPFSVPGDFNVGNVSSELLSNVNDLVNNVLANDQDPVASIYFFGGQYLTRVNPAIRGELQVNTFTTGNQQNPSIAMDSAGDFIVAWESQNQDGSGWGIFAQEYNNSGSAVGPEFLVNTVTTMDQRFPAVAMDSSGDFVVTWQRSLTPFAEVQADLYIGYGIYAQRYNSNRVKVGSEFRVNTHTTSGQKHPAIAMDSSGDFVITWQSQNQDGNNYGIFAQRYSSAGTPAGSEFQVNTFTFGIQENPAVAMDSAGDFVVSWQSYAQDGSNYGIFAQRYSSSGAAAGSEFQVNIVTASSQETPSVAMDSTGNFVVAWANRGVGQILFRQFDSGGSPLSNEIQANTFVSGGQTNPSIAMGNNGNFVIAWPSGGEDGSNDGVYARRFNSNGSAVSSEFQVNTFTIGNQNNPAIAMDSNGDFVITWQSGPYSGIGQQDGDNYGVYAQRYNKNGVAE